MFGQDGRPAQSEDDAPLVICSSSDTVGGTLPPYSQASLTGERVHRPIARIRHV